MNAILFHRSEPDYVFVEFPLFWGSPTCWGLCLEAFSLHTQVSPNAIESKVLQALGQVLPLERGFSSD